MFFKTIRDSPIILKYFTTIFDYCWLLGILTIINYCLIDNYSPLRVALTVNMFLLGFLREYLYIYIFPNQISKDKKDFKITNELIFCYLKVKAAFFLVMGLISYFDFFYWKFLDYNLSGYDFVVDSLILYSNIYIDFTIMILTKELQLEFFHNWMHNPIRHFPKSWNMGISKLHKLHHKTTTDVSLMSGFYVNFFDVVLENLAAPILIFVLKYYMGYEAKMNLISFLMLVIFDMHCHSVNPYTQAFYNPVLDYLMKPTIAHCLHHVYPRTNHRQVPLHHLWYEYRKSDFEKYNIAHKTSFV